MTIPLITKNWEEEISRTSKDMESMVDAMLMHETLHELLHELKF